MSTANDTQRKLAEAMELHARMRADIEHTKLARMAMVTRAMGTPDGSLVQGGAIARATIDNIAKSEHHAADISLACEVQRLFADTGEET